MNKSLKVILVVMALTMGMGRMYSQNKKITIEKDAILVDGNYYATMKKKSAGLFVNDFSIRNHEDVELIYMKYSTRPVYDTYGRMTNEGFYIINFIGSGSTVDLYKLLGAQGAAKLVVENSLIKNDAIDFVAEQRFVQINHGFTPKNDAPINNQPTIIINNGNNSAPAPEVKPTPAAKSTAKISLNGNQILNNGTVIGKFREETSSSAYSQKMLIVTIYSESGDKVAEASAPVSNAAEWSVKTLSDNKTTNIMYDAPGEKERLFKWLVDKNYL